VLAPVTNALKGAAGSGGATSPISPVSNLPVVGGLLGSVTPSK
jgi:hypothetical protein